MYWHLEQNIWSQWNTLSFWLLHPNETVDVELNLRREINKYSRLYNFAKWDFDDVRILMSPRECRMPLSNNTINPVTIDVPYFPYPFLFFSFFFLLVSFLYITGYIMYALLVFNAPIQIAANNVPNFTPNKVYYVLFFSFCFSFSFVFFFLQYILT